MKFWDKLKKKKPKKEKLEATEEPSQEHYVSRYTDGTRNNRSNTARPYQHLQSRNIFDPLASYDVPYAARRISAAVDPFQFSQTLTGQENLVTIPSPATTDTTGPGSILIGIDFGTTFSGVAWAYSKQPEDIEIVTNWNCIDTENSDRGKAPTKIAYGRRRSKRTSSGSEENEQTTWGYGVDSENAVEWFKLLLLDEADMDEEQRESAQIQRAKLLLREAGRTPVQAVGDYLRLLWQHAISNIERSLGQATVDGLAFKVVCTVPAVWTNAAVGRMRKAAKAAGITTRRTAGVTTLDFVSEPEAAALATFEDLKLRPNLQVGDTYVVCDAGGGTVDLISYKVTQKSPLHLEECVEGSGQLCGAIFLDQDFEAMIAQRLGDAWNVSDSVKTEMMNSQWERGIKKAFEDQDQTWKVTIPYHCVVRGAPPAIFLEKAHVKDMFENIVSRIRRLVDSQIAAVESKENKLPKGIVLVGGFGSCRYIHKVLDRENRHRHIEVLQSSGAKPWTSICRGAVLSALQNSHLRRPVVRARIVRCNYGTKFMTPFDAKVHLECDRRYYERYAKDYATNQMCWYLMRGDNMAVAQNVRKPWCDAVPCDLPQLSHEFDLAIYGCRSHEPPTRRDSTVKQSCSLKSDNPVDISDIPVVKNPRGKAFKDVDFELEMKVIGAAVEFVIIFDGKEVGRSQLVPEL